ncbi:MAG: hypothetical protein JWM59_4095 [Verrucomicrobiales bacterium]|nr:hypothetical protein [Verrucomicrobiales bacterium]
MAPGLNILANVFNQAAGAVDNAWETEAERTEGKPKQQRDAEKEKKAKREAGLKEDAAKCGPRPSGGEMMG